MKQFVLIFRDNCLQAQDAAAKHDMNVNTFAMYLIKRTFCRKVEA